MMKNHSLTVCERKHYEVYGLLKQWKVDLMGGGWMGQYLPQSVIQKILQGLIIENLHWS